MSEAEPGDHGRLAFYLPNLHTGGAEQVTVSIVNGLAARGHDVELLVSRREGNLESRVSPAVAVTTLSRFHVPMLGIAAHVPAMAQYLRREEPAAVFPQMTHSSVVCLAAARLVETDTLVFPTNHCAYGRASDGSLKSRTLGRLSRYLLPTADHVIGVSQGVADSIVEELALSPADVSVLHNPVDSEAIYREGDDPVDQLWLDDDEHPVMLSVGRLEPQKDHETWLRGFARVHETRPETRAIIAGKGSEQERIRALAEELGLSEVVSLPGYVDNQYAFMRRADVFALSSRYEGLPTVLIEALACGCPVVSTDCPSGPDEILDGGTYGPLVDVGDADGLAEAVLATLTHPPDARTLRARAADFDPDVVLDKYERFLGAHLPGRSPAPVTREGRRRHSQ